MDAKSGHARISGPWALLRPALNVSDFSIGPRSNKVCQCYVLKVSDSNNNHSYAFTCSNTATRTLPPAPRSSLRVALVYLSVCPGLLLLSLSCCKLTLLKNVKEVQNCYNVFIKISSKIFGSTAKYFFRILNKILVPNCYYVAKERNDLKLELKASSSLSRLVKQLIKWLLILCCLVH